MSYSTANFNDVLASCQLDRSSELLDSKTIRRAFADAECDFGHQEHTVFDKSTTLWAFLREMLRTGTERTLKAAVADVQQLRIAKGLAPNSGATGSYSHARMKIDAKVPQTLMQALAKNAEPYVPREMRLCGLHVSELDGSSNSLQDSERNQEEYPQSKTQKAGLGFPMWRVVVLISAVTAMVQIVAVGPWRGKGTGEASLFVSLFEQLRKAASWIEVIVANRYYCLYHLIAVLAHFHIRFVTRLHGSRLINFADAETVRRKRNGDFHVVWKRPQRPFWMLDWMWNVVPETMILRLVRVRVETAGARTKGFFVVTNLMDDKAYPSQAIRELYRGRWNVEVDSRTIKSFIELEVLRAKTPELAETEFAMGLLAYNTVRAKMLQTATAVRREAATDQAKENVKTSAKKAETTGNKIEPKDMNARNVSFSIALTSIVSAYVTVHFMNGTMRKACRDITEANRQTVQVGNRPDRVEPRCNKRRPKPHRLMQEPCQVLRERLLQGHCPTQDGDEAAEQLGEG
jgi:hypothetical protein